MAKHKRRKLNEPERRTQHRSSQTKAQQPAKPAKSKKSEPIFPFEAEDRMLLVGEGDFSFAKSIVEHHGCCDVMATCLDSKEGLFEKYKPQAENHVQYLEEEGQVVHYNVDATKLDSIKALKKGGLFERIIFNFPHVGGKTKDVNRQVRFNQELLVNFFAAAIALLTPNGTIVVTLFEGEPYTLWNVRDLARHSGLEVRRSFKFMADAYPGYSHGRTLGNIEGGGGWKGEEREARSFEFCRKGLQVQQGGRTTKKRRRDGEDSESDD